jgi:hypothetical protein
MTGGLIGLKDQEIDVGERTKSLMTKRYSHFMTTLRSAEACVIRHGSTVRGVGMEKYLILFGPWGVVVPSLSSPYMWKKVKKWST